MALTVRNKIWLGTSFLFLLLLLIGVAGIYYTATLKDESKEILKDNYESLLYCYEMRQQLDSLDINAAQSLIRFEASLELQEKNITEPGEDVATRLLRASFNKLKSGDSIRQNIKETQSELQRVLYLNMNAIHLKNAKAEETAERALTIIIGLATMVFIISFAFSVNFPSIVSNPMRQLAEAIKEIANKNYRHRIFMDNKDEFGSLADAFNGMAQRLEYFENSNLNQILFEKSRAEAVINSLKDASIGIDKNNNVLFANFQAVQLLGLRSAEIVGRPIAELSKKNELFNFLVHNETPAPFKIVVENRENYFTKEVIEVAQGEGSSKVIVLRNITSFKELDTAKTNFIATISHELKTPLAASDFGLKLLEDERVGKLSDEQKELIRNLKQDNRRMLKILSELLNMSQVETGRIQLNIQAVGPLLIVENAVATVASSARDKNVEIISSTGNNFPAVMADVEKSTWVLNNFLTNAIKYSPVGGKINLVIKPEKGSLVFSVADSGPGIASKYLPRLFERYFQVPGPGEKGTGLGLAISKDFIEAQKGEIWVESEEGKGAAFSFSLPLAGHKLA